MRTAELPAEGVEQTEALSVEAEGLGWTYAGRSRPAIEGLTFGLRPGRVLLVLGPSGSGKSTLARAIAGLVPHVLPGAWQGSLRVGGLEVAGTPARFLGERVGLVFQDPDSQLVMSRVDDEVAFGLENRGWPREAMVRRVPEVLRQVGLNGFEDRRTLTLSGGEKQRLGIAGVLAARPGLLVLDEPTANLDPPGMHAVFETLTALARQRRQTIVLIEHRLDAALPLADDVLLLDDDGRQLAFCPASDIDARSIDRLERTGAWLPRAWRGSDAGRPGLQTNLDGRAAGRDSPVVVRVSDVTIEYPLDAAGRHVALEDVSLVVRAGERVGIVGPNGSGKSSLLMAMAGVLRPRSGKVTVAGAGWPLPAGVAFQDPELGFVARTVADEVRASAREASDAEAQQLLAHFGLGQLAQFDPFRLSQGEQRRLSLAALALRPPAVLLLDEPTFGLDRRGTKAVVSLLDRTRAQGEAQVLATHDPRLLPACDRVVALSSGRVVFDGSPESFLADPPYQPAAPWREGVA